MDNHSNRAGQYVILVLVLLAGAGISVFSNCVLSPVSSSGQASGSGAREIMTVNWIRPLLMFLIMLAGMFFNQIFENLKAQKAEGHTTTNVLRLFTTGWKAISFWMAIVVSPIIFYGTYYLVDALPDGNVAYFYAFQNGFFWYNIFNRFEVKPK
jgi:hypothetical protein